MSEFTPLTITEQVVEHLRSDLLQGRWKQTIPGKHRLATELGVNNKTVEIALCQLEREGLLLPQGRGRKRLVAPSDRRIIDSIRVALVPFGDSNDEGDLRLHQALNLNQALSAAGHTPFFTGKSVLDLGSDTTKMLRLVEQTAADAWVISAGTHEVLKWFSARPEPSFALFGRRDGLSLPSVGPDIPSAYAAVARHLISVGHRRIVLLCRDMRRMPEPGNSEQTFLDELTAHGLPVGEFNLPHWENTEEGFHKLLDKLFRHTPPSALIADEPLLYTAAQHFCSQHGLQIPEDVSLICSDADPSFEWCRPSVAHIAWDSRAVTRRVVQWVSNVSRGKKDLRQTATKAHYVKGGTVAPPKGG